MDPNPGVARTAGPAGTIWPPTDLFHIVTAPIDQPLLSTRVAVDETRDLTLDRLRAQLSDRYEVERKLGAGGMAAVYLAKDIKHDRQVAIKVLHPELAATIGGDRFEREIRTAAKLQHPNILGMFDSGVADGLLFYVMPFVEGESLRDRLDRESQLPVEDAIQITLEVADALGYAHAKGIVHRDIKPDNVMLSGGHALVADFGIARAAGEAGSAKLTSTGMSVGTPTYMAPEQAVGESVGPTADLYSLGCMLYEMLAGDPPFTGKNGAAIMAKHAMEAVPSVRIVRQSVPEEVEQAIFAAMGKVPADRPQTAAAFSEILGIPLGTTATRRVVGRITGAQRVITGAQPVLEAAPPAWRKPWVIAATVVLVAAGAFAAWKASVGGPAPAGQDAGGLSRRRVAVLYFDDLSRDSSLGYVSDGLTEGLIANLASVQGLSVVSPGGSDQVRGTTLSLDSVARLLNVGTIVRGSVEPSGDRIRINVRLVDGVGGGDIGDRKALTLPADQFVAARDSLTSAVAELLRSEIGLDVLRSQQRAETGNSAAWSLVQRAEQLRKRGEAAAGGGDQETMHREFSGADSLLAEAERLDGDWVRPVIARANLDYRRSRLVPRDPVAIRTWLDSGMVDVNRALARQANDPDALELRGNLQYWGWLVNLYPDQAEAQRILLAAQADFERATELNPQQAGAFASLSHLYYQNGSNVDINLAARRALEADAFLSNADVVLDRLFLSSYDLDQFTDAEKWCAELQRRFPGNFTAPRCGLYLMTMRSGKPQPDSAWALAERMAALAPATRQPLQEMTARQLVAAVLARAGLADSARRVSESSLGTAEVDPTRDLQNAAAFVSTLVGDTAQAVQRLGVYLSANPRRLAGYALDPGWWFRPIQADRRFRLLVGAAPNR